VNRVSIAIVLVALVLAAFCAPSLAWAGEEPCSSTKAAEDLLGCDHCYQLKSILGEIRGAELTIEVYDLDRGVLIDLEGTNEAGIEFVRAVVAEMWGLGTVSGVTSTASYCDVCSYRSRKLQTVERDLASKDMGSIVVMTSLDDDLVQWLREDARTQKHLVDRATASN
jgi:hypothetical protein